MKTPLAYYDNIGRNDLSTAVAQSAVLDVIVCLNDRPSKKLGYKTPAKLMAEHMVA
jgi:IS30 family transposase